MELALDQDCNAEHNESTQPNLQHLDKALNEQQVSEFEDEVELWITYGGD